MRAMLLLAPLAACSSLTPAPTLRYAGPVTPTTQGRTCVETRGVAIIRADHVLFAPDNGTWTLDGATNPDGTLTAEHASPGLQHQPYETRLEATLTPTTLTGTYTTPRCTYKVQLTKSS